MRRPRLFTALTRAAQGPVTVISGPPGCGKTTLVASWLAEAEPPGPVAWVSLPSDERDATRFWRAVAAAVRGATAPDGGPEPAAERQPAAERLPARLGEIAPALPAPLVLVLDDLQRLRSAEALAGLADLLAAQVPQLRLLLLTRADPRLGLHRLRVAGALTELRAADLEFTRRESAQLLHTAGLDLPERDAVRLHDRTEGWAAGLRLAALALAGHPDPAGFVREFSGSERTVADYLDGEVLAGQPPEVRGLLLRTSVLDRVNGPLAHVLAGRPDGELLLQRLEDANAFVTAVDVGRSWFRFHRLLTDLLRSELRREAPEQVRDLHRTAARWHAEHALPVEAIRHAQAGEDWAYASDLLEARWLGLFLDGRQSALRELLDGLPEERARADAEVTVLLAADRLAGGAADDADAYLAATERLAGAVPDAHRRRFEATLAVVRLLRARARGDLGAAAGGARAILEPPAGEAWADVAASEDLRAIALMHLGFAELWRGRLHDAERRLREGAELARRRHRPYALVGCLASGAEAAVLRQDLGAAEARGREAVDLAARLDLPDSPVVGAAMLGLGSVHVARGRWEEGESWLDRAARALGEVPGPEAGLLLRSARGMLRFGQGRYGPALESFGAAAQAAADLPGADGAAGEALTWALRARLRLGEAEAVRAAIRAAGEAAAAPQWRTVAASLALAEDRPRAALDALAPVLDGTGAAGGAQLAVETRLLEAIARDRLGEAPEAQRALERALDLAEPEGRAGIVLAVPAVRPLLERHPRHRTTHAAFIAELLDDFGGGSPPASGTADRDVAASLSDRELAVLGFLPTNLSATEIAHELVLSVHTVKTHMRTLYGKLDVHRRADAVERARALGILAPSRRR